ncbi:MAG: hypothetical protein IJ779_04450 [Ruminococcus sp.]|nr:hypothetical protein [Ruminococcus sp.]
MERRGTVPYRFIILTNKIESREVYSSSIDNSGGSGIIESRGYYAGLGEKLEALKAKITNSLAIDDYKEVSEEYLNSLPRYTEPLSIKESLMLTNPTNDEYNCQRCVPAYEMLRRGYKVHATLAPKNWLDDNIGFGDFKKIFIGSEWHQTNGSGIEDIEKFLTNAGNNARVEISFMTTDGSHLIVAENDNGLIKFVDPQKNRIDVRWYFDDETIILGKTEFARIDNLNVSNLIKQCLEVEV